MVVRLSGRPGGYARQPAKSNDGRRKTPAEELCLMLNSRLEKQLYYLLRQVAGCVEQGDSLESAVSKVKQITSTSGRQAQLLDQLIMPSAQSTPGTFGIMKRMQELLSVVKTQQGNLQEFFGTFYQAFLQTHPRNLFRIYDISGLMTYLGMVIVIMTVVVTIYMIYVLPEFRSLFDNVGAPLPYPTKLLLQISDSVGVYLLVLIIIAMFAIWYINFRTSYNLRTLGYCQSFIYRLPGIRTIAHNYNEYLTLNFLHILLQSGVKTEPALNAIAQLSGQTFFDLHSQTPPTNPLARELRHSYQLGNLATEVVYQIEHAIVSNTADFNRVKDTMTLMTLVAVAVLVGNVVIAMYLPIFQMGKIII
jgi:type II secretory pathway component PulF